MCLEKKSSSNEWLVNHRTGIPWLKWEQEIGHSRVRLVLLNTIKKPQRPDNVLFASFLHRSNFHRSYAESQLHFMETNPGYLLLSPIHTVSGAAVFVW